MSHRAVSAPLRYALLVGLAGCLFCPLLVSGGPVSGPERFSVAPPACSCEMPAPPSSVPALLRRASHLRRLGAAGWHTAGQFGRGIQVAVLDANFEHPAPSDLIYWSDQVPGFGKRDPTAEEIVDFGLSYVRRILPREELVRLVHSYMHPRRPADNDQESYYMISENVRGFEINHLSDWARRRGMSAAELVENALNGNVAGDPHFQGSLAETTSDCD